MKRSLDLLIAELRTAIAQDRGAKAEALRCGMNATQPLTLVRLGELCALGDRMHMTTARRRMAAASLYRAMARVSLFAKPDKEGKALGE